MRRTLIISTTLLVAILLVLALAMSGFATPLASTVIAAPSAGNQVEVGFFTSWNHHVYGDSFTNAEVNGFRQWRISDIINTPDETGEPIRGLRAKLDSQLDFDWVRDIDLVRRGPPTYEWFYGDISEDYIEYRPHATDAWVLSLQYIDKLAPGLDVCRTFDKTVFTGPGTQTMTVTITPREEWLDRVPLAINTYPHKLVDASITSVNSGGNINLAPDGRWLHIQDIPAQLNTPVNVTVTIKVTPKVPKVEFKPSTHVKIDPPRHSETIRGTTTGSSFSYTNEAGTWTVSAEGDYVWTWEDDDLMYGVVLFFSENTPPTLISAGVSPPSGTPKTDFTFEVTYRDTDQGEGGTSVPSYVRVYIDDSARDMGNVSGKYADGALFSHTTTLSAGSHTYYFEASDGSFTARFPEDGTLSIEVTREGQEPTPAPSATPTPESTQEPTPAPSATPTPESTQEPTPAAAPLVSEGINLWLVVAIVAGIAIIGSAIYFFIRRREEG